MLLFLVLILTQTNWFREKVKERIIKIADKNLNGQLKIGELNGNFYSHLELINVSFSEGSNKIVSIPSLTLHYNLTALRSRRILVDSAIVVNPEFSLIQKPDSSWNVQEVFLKKEKQPKKAGLPFPFKIDVKHLEIFNAAITSSSFIEFIPDTVTGLNVLVSGSIRSKEIQAQLQNLNFTTKNPDFKLVQLRTFFLKNDDGITIDSLLLRTEASNLFVDGNYKSIDLLHGNAEINPLDNKELEVFVPSFKMVCTPVIKTKFKSENDSTSVFVQLINNDQQIELDAQLFALNKSLKGEKTAVPYHANIRIKNVSPESWIEMEKSNSLLNGNIELNGTDVLHIKSSVSVNANLRNSVYYDNEFSTLNISGNYNNDNFEGEIEMASEKGSANFNGTINNLTSESPEYKGLLVTDNLNLTSLVPAMKGTLVNATIQANGKGFSMENMDVKAQMTIRNSTIYNIPLDTAFLSAHFSENKVILDTLQAKVPDGFLNGSGRYEITPSFLSAKVQAEIDSLHFLNYFVQLPVSFDSLFIESQIEGPVSDMIYSGYAVIHDFSGYSVQAKRSEAQVSGRIEKDSMFTLVNINLEKLLTGTVVWDSVLADVNYAQKQIEARVNANWKDTLQLNFKTRIEMGDTMNIEIPSLDAKTPLSDFYLPDSTLSILYSENELNIGNLWIKDRENTDFNLKLNGILNLKQTDNINLTIDNLDLKHINRFVSMQDSVSGLLSSKISVSGTPENPSMEGTINIENPRYGTISISSFSSQMQYNNKNANLRFELPDIGGNGYVDADVQISVDTSGFVFIPPKTFDGEFKIDSLHLTQVIKNNLSTFEVEGDINLDVKANGEITNPKFNGNINLANGHLLIPKYGIDYKDALLKVKFDNNRINVDTLLLKQDKGFLTVYGEMVFDSTIISGNIKEANMNLKANNFFIVKNRASELQINANTFVKTENNKPSFGGNVDILRSDINLDKIIPKDRNDDDSELEPLLVQAIYELPDTIETMVPVDEKTGQNKVKSDFQRNLTGKIRISIPRNTWIRSENMKLELQGDIDFQKTGTNFQMYGDVTIIRGQYILYGRKLVLRESNIYFDGSDDFDPTLNISTEYTFRDNDKVKRVLGMSINGLLSDPEIIFSLDGEQTTESEAVSILIFGKTMEESDSYGQGLVGSVGSNMVAQVLTAQLNKTIGSRLNLDMIEINATENWTSAAFVVGKYITNDLFVTYQRGFGETDGEEITPETLTLEYELNRFIFLHLQSGSSKTSGLDVILKFEEKERN